MNLPGIYNIFLNQWKDCQTCWIISDTHFGDNDLCQGIQNRPSDEEVVKLINSKCGKTDILIHLGDVGNLEYVRQLRAKSKILIMGNHDAGRTNYEDVFQEIYEGPVMIGEKLILSHEPVNIPWAFNIHGHIHDARHKNDTHHLNVCSDVIGYTPVNMNQLMKSGILSKVETIHRTTINTATTKARKRNISKKIK